VRIALALIFVLCASVAVAHDEFVLDARRATPGPRLELIELTPSTVPAARRYRLQVQVGLPRNVIFRVLTKDFSHGFHTVASGFQLDAFGDLVSIEAGKAGRALRLDEIVLEPGPYPRGAAWEAALVSADRAIRLFAKTIPYPITARDGSCAVSLELVSQRGDRFVATGIGFVPGDDVIIESRYSGRFIQRGQRISPDGLFLPDSIAHGAPGSDHSARYTVRGQSCEVVVDYVWGEPAVIRR
jgi:hypothetical protein